MGFGTPVLFPALAEPLLPPLPELPPLLAPPQAAQIKPTKTSASTQCHLQNLGLPSMILPGSRCSRARRAPGAVARARSGRLIMGLSCLLGAEAITAAE